MTSGTGEKATPPTPFGGTVVFLWGCENFLGGCGLHRWLALVGCGKKDLPEPQAKTPETPKTDVNATATPKIQPKVGAKNPQTPKATSAKLIADLTVEMVIRISLEKPKGKLTEADLAKVTRLSLYKTQITDERIKEVAKLQNLTFLNLGSTKITDAGAAELRKVLPNCNITHSYKKD